MIRLDNRAGEMLLDLTNAIERQVAELPTPYNEFDWARLRQSIREQLSAPEHAVDLVDTISSHLLHRSNRGGIVGDNLRRFQQALLMPSELSKLRAMGTDTLACRSCGRHPSYMEMVTMTPSGEIMCSLCDMPTYLVAQNTCAGHRDLAARVEIPVKALRAIRLAAKQSQAPDGCPHCAAEIAAQAKGVQQAEAGSAEGGAFTFSWNRLQGRPRTSGEPQPVAARSSDRLGNAAGGVPTGPRIVSWVNDNDPVPTVTDSPRITFSDTANSNVSSWTEPLDIEPVSTAPMAEIVRDDAPEGPEANLSAQMRALLDIGRQQDVRVSERFWSQRRAENPPPPPTQRARPAGPRTRPEGS